MGCGALTPIRRPNCSGCGNAFPVKPGRARKQSVGLGAEDFSEVAVSKFLKGIDVRQVLLTMIQSNKGTKSSFGGSYVHTVEEFMKYIAVHGYRMVKVPGKSLDESLRKAEAEYRQVRIKYGVDKDDDEVDGGDSEEEVAERSAARRRRHKRMGLAGGGLGST